MKLAMLYTTWTGDDMAMLKDSIENHLPYVDGVLVFMDECSLNMEHWPFAEKHRIDFQLSNSKVQLFRISENEMQFGNTKECERFKHDKMIQEAKKQGFTHFILSAGDHFYNPEAFEIGKRHFSEFDTDVSLTKMITYYRDKQTAVWPLEDYYMPFIHKMHPNTEISRNTTYLFRVDPSVKVNTSYRIHLFDEFYLHHYSMVRKNIKRKFRNAASSIRWTNDQIKTFISEFENAKIGDKITYYQGRELKNIDEVLQLIKELP